MSNVLIVTRTKNRPVLLARAIFSVQRQTFTDFTHVIVNDGGDTEEVDKLVQELNVGRVYVIHNDKCLGMEAASNIGLKSHPATYTVIHDDDDSWEPHFLQQSVTYLDNHPEKAGVVCNIKQIFEQVNSLQVEKLSSRLFNPTVKTFKLNDFFVVNQFVPIAFLYRYKLHDEIGFYDEGLKVCGDLDFFIRILKKYNIAKISACLANYHIRIDPVQEGITNSVINSVSNKQTHKLFSQQVLDRYDDRSLFIKTVTWLRVKLIYRIFNVLIRLTDKVST